MAHLGGSAVGAACDSVYAGHFECHTADGKGLAPRALHAQQKVMPVIGYLSYFVLVPAAS